MAKTALQEAKQQRDDNLKFDSVWAVFDVDAHPHLPEAQQLAAAEGIEVALSNPSFELWALLHIEEQRAHIERHVAASRIRHHFPDYEKLLPFENLIGGYERAVERAKSLETEAAHHSDPGRNPSTAVYKLTELIRTG